MKEVKFNNIPANSVEMDRESIRPVGFIRLHCPYTSTISFSVKGFTSPALSSWLTNEGMLDIKSTFNISSELPSSWNNCWKCILAVGCKCIYPLIISPSLVQISYIWLQESLTLHCRWKNVEFLSPARNQILWDFSCRCSSSYRKERKEVDCVVCSIGNFIVFHAKLKLN